MSCTVFEIAQGELRGVVECLAGGIAEGGQRFGDAGFVEQFLGVEDGLLGRLQHRIEPPQHAHGQNDIAVLAPHEQIAEHVIRDAPDERHDLIVCSLIHMA